MHVLSTSHLGTGIFDRWMVELNNTEYVVRQSLDSRPHVLYRKHRPIAEFHSGTAKKVDMYEDPEL